MTQAQVSRDARKQETRARILDAAARLYLSRGLDGVALDDVAREAQRTKGAVYGHFADKEALLIALWRGHYAEKRALIGAALAHARDAASLRALLREAMASVFALGAWPALAVDVRRRPEYAALAAELSALETAELAGLAEHFRVFAARIDVPPPEAPQEIAATLFALAEGLMLREKLAPEVAAARFMSVFDRLSGLPA